MKIVCDVPYALNLTGNGSAPYPCFAWNRRAVLALAVRPGGHACRVVLSRRSDHRFVADLRAIPPRALSYLLRALPPRNGWTATILPAPALRPVGRDQRPDPSILVALAATLSVATGLPLATPALIEAACRAELAAGAVPDLAGYYAAVLGGLRMINPAGPRPEATIRAEAVTPKNRRLACLRGLMLIPENTGREPAVFLGGRPFRTVIGNRIEAGIGTVIGTVIGTIPLRPDTTGLRLEVI